jgi:hypothetical protein
MCVVLILAALPGVTLACQWVCDGTVISVTAGGYHHGGHDHTHALVGSNQGTADGPAMRPVGRDCDHSRLSDVAVITPGLQIFAPVAFVLPDTLSAMALLEGYPPLPPTATYSPPGARSGAVPLRI